MRIAYLSTQRAYYGGEVHLCQLAAGMQARGHAVRCVVRPDSLLLARLRQAGVPVTPLPVVDWYEPVGVLRLRRWLRDGGCDVLHTHTPRDHYVAAVATLGLDVRNVGTRHQLLPIARSGLKRPWLGRLDAMVAVSEAVRQGIVRSGALPPDRVVTIHNGVDVRRQLPARNGLRRSLGLPALAPVVGYVGRLSPDKGVETLLEAARRLVDDSWPHLKVFIVGDDPRGRHGEHLCRRSRELGLQDAVHFFGYVHDAARACADFDVQVVTSTAEPFGLVTLEAMAHRHPVVATDAGGSREILRDGRDGYLVPPHRADLLAARLDLLLREPALRRSLGDEARRRVESRFGLDQMIAATESLYRQVVVVPRRGRDRPAAGRRSGPCRS
ncbi:MAG: glycosyltransferase family 4 protein [Candidatus Krumholzibacteriia bacterium]